MESVTSQRVPSVVARLMGLEVLSSESTANIQPKPAQIGSKLTRSMSDKQFQKQKQKQDIQYVPKELLVQPKRLIREPVNPSSYSLKEKTQSEFARKKSHGQKDKLKDGEASKHSLVMKLEQMKRQLALEQLLVQEKLIEAKRLLAGEQSSSFKQAVTHTSISDMEAGLDSRGLLISSKSLSRSYLENKDRRVSKCSEGHFAVGSKMVTNKKPNRFFNFASTEDVSDSAVASPRPIESRRHYDLNMFDAREAGTEACSQRQATSKQSDFSTRMLESGYKGMDWDLIRYKYSSASNGECQRPTRIVVLKPGPMVQSDEELFMSLSSNSNAHQCEPVIDESMSLERRFKGNGQDMQENPREIAREIARQVREKVIRELARKNKRTGSPVTINRNVESPEITAIPEIGDHKASEVDLERFKAHSKGMASLNKPDESNLMIKNGERTLSKEKIRVKLSENDLTDDKIVIYHQEKLFADGGSNGGCVFKSQDFKFSNKGEAINALSFDPLPDIGTFSKYDEGKVKSSQQVSEALVQCTESRLSRPLSLNSWLPVDGSLHGDANEQLERETGSGHNSGNATIQDKGLIFEQLKESCNEMQTNLGDKDALEEETNSGSSYFLPMFHSHIKSGGDFSDPSLHNSEDRDLTYQTPTLTNECSARLEDFRIGSDGSETSEELSPVSVLVSSFEGSPNQAYVDDHAFPIKELPVHLQLLKRDPITTHVDDLEEDGDSEDERLFWQAGSFPPRISSNVYSDGVMSSSFSCNKSLQYQNFQMDDIRCPEGKVEDLSYIRCVLNASGFTGSKEAYFTNWHSPRHAIDPSLFQTLENNLFTMFRGESTRASTDGRSEDRQGSPNLEPSCPSIGVDFLHRRLLFDGVDDILLQKLKSRINCLPWFRPPKLAHMLLPSGKQLLKEIWSQLCTFDQQHDGKASLARSEANEDQWIKVQEEVHQIAFELEQVVFSELMKEIVIEQTLPKSF